MPALGPAAPRSGVADGHRAALRVRRRRPRDLARPRAARGRLDDGRAAGARSVALGAAGAGRRGMAAGAAAAAARRAVGAARPPAPRASASRRSSSRSLRSTGPAGQNARRGMPANSASSVAASAAGSRSIRARASAGRPSAAAASAAMHSATSSRAARVEVGLRRVRGGRRRRRSASAPRRGPRGPCESSGVAPEQVLQLRAREGQLAQPQVDARDPDVVGADSAGGGRGAGHAGSRRWRSRPRRDRAGRDDGQPQRLVAEQLAGEPRDVGGGHPLDRRERLVERQDAIVERLLPADPRREVARLLHPQLEPAGEVGLGLARAPRAPTGSSRSVASSRRIASSARPTRPGSTPAVTCSAPASAYSTIPERHVVGERVAIDERQEQRGCSSRRRGSR